MAAAPRNAGLREAVRGTYQEHSQGRRSRRWTDTPAAKRPVGHEGLSAIYLPTVGQDQDRQAHVPSAKAAFRNLEQSVERSPSSRRRRRSSSLRRWRSSCSRIRLIRWRSSRLRRADSCRMVCRGPRNQVTNVDRAIDTRAEMTIVNNLSCDTRLSFLCGALLLCAG